MKARDGKAGLVYGVFSKRDHSHLRTLKFASLAAAGRARLKPDEYLCFLFPVGK